MIVQRDRNYLLRVGIEGKKTLEITGLHCTFKVQKSSDNKKKGNHASVSVYNLSDENRKAIESSKTTIALDVGYYDTGLYELFSGEVTDVETKRSGEDIFTTFTLDSAYTGLNHKLISKLIAPNTSIEDLFRQVAKLMPEITQTKFSGPSLKKKVVDGYPANGTPRQILTEVCDAYGLEWQIDSGILYVTDVTHAHMTDKQTFVLNEMSGLIERPEVEEIEEQRSKNDKKKKGRKGLKIQCLLNPLIKSGGLIKLEFGDLTGLYKVIDVSHVGEVYGNTWMTTMTVGSKES